MWLPYDTAIGGCFEVKTVILLLLIAFIVYGFHPVERWRYRHIPGMFFVCCGTFSLFPICKLFFFFGGVGVGGCMFEFAVIRLSYWTRVHIQSLLSTEEIYCYLNMLVLMFLKVLL